MTGPERRIAVLGGIMVDHLLPFGANEWITSFGGILYNTLRLAPLIAPWGVVRPVAWIGQSHHAALHDFLAAYPNVDLEGLAVCETGSDENTLRFITPTEREETMTRRCPALSREMLAGVVECDWVHFNCITQRELELVDLEWLQGKLSGVFSMDLHNRVARFDEAGHLLRGTFPQWQEWMECVDVVQMNEHECAAILGRVAEREEDFRAAARAVAEVGPREILLTWGARGSFVAWSGGGGEYRWAHVPPTSHPAVDTTGCGDSFSAAYQSRRLVSDPPLLAAMFAGAVSGWNAARSGLFQSADASHFHEIMQRELREPLARFRDGWRGEEL